MSTYNTSREEIAIVSFVELTPAEASQLDEIETIQTIVSRATDGAGIARDRIGFTVSGSCDMLVGRPFSWIMAMDGAGVSKPIEESHVEMDGAWALYEAWVRLQHGDIDAALIYSFGANAAEDLMQVLALQLDPYYLAPTGINAAEVAALQASAMLAAGATERQFAEVAVRAGLASSVEAALAEPYTNRPLRASDLPRFSDGAVAMVIARGDYARSVCARPAWIQSMAHIADSHSLGVRDLSKAPSLEKAARLAGVGEKPTDLVEVHAPFGPQEVLAIEALRAAGLHGTAALNPSGGTRAAQSVMVAGLAAIGRAASAIHRGEASRTVGHASSGPALQHNLIAVLEERS
jgi:hypothetical protein